MDFNYFLLHFISIIKIIYFLFFFIRFNKWKYQKIFEIEKLFKKSWFNSKKEFENESSIIENLLYLTIRRRKNDKLEHISIFLIIVFL